MAKQQVGLLDETLVSAVVFAGKTGVEYITAENNEVQDVTLVEPKKVSTKAGFRPSFKGQDCEGQSM